MSCTVGTGEVESSITDSHVRPTTKLWGSSRAVVAAAAKATTAAAERSENTAVGGTTTGGVPYSVGRCISVDSKGRHFTEP